MLSNIGIPGLMLILFILAVIAGGISLFFYLLFKIAKKENCEKAHLN
ncbi:hypothetical protein AWH56_018725 [Anaerobacillus isosaccharinicus]|uniref:Uncharacterized protein n=1 Tax=Anaerobacillus isosaccharinicus TaxID=1532552 RepID=A0A7S7RAF0_9BACI|nr:hypothetical protein [Anaerobacillus isosaccharinicus]MBA5587060.1 hypothetical protein [Anaerobacillus isosaccharinicus]QOY34743.1 hypothetical protein AWH56_018725 [Anaerobacillus isosaccharinicus]